jgi:hypothetical protein
VDVWVVGSKSSLIDYLIQKISNDTIAGNSRSWLFEVLKFSEGASFIFVGDFSIQIWELQLCHFSS